MRIRSILLIAFLMAALLPTGVLAWWSYERGVAREFAEVHDRHLLLARNVGAALKRYHMDIVGASESLSQALLHSSTPSDVGALMSSINLACILIVDEKTGEIVAQTDRDPTKKVQGVPEAFLTIAREIARSDKTVFSQVLESRHAGNVMLAVRRYEDKLSIAVLDTNYFIQLGASIAFGKKGHAAIVDHKGNVLAHPLPSWIAARKNIAKVSAVKRMMNGETGIQQFYSPALKGDMIAGLTSVDGPGWGVMIPQPVEEIYQKVRDNNNAITMAVAVALLVTLVFVLLFVNSLAAPLEKFLAAMKLNVRNETFGENSVRLGLIPVREVADFKHNYNVMARQVSMANETMREIAYTDGVTGLPNREHLREIALTRLLIPNALRSSGILAFIDLDNFKQINDVHGHSVGDQFLKDCAEKLQNCVSDMRSSLSLPNAKDLDPVVARIGGDEFVVIFPGLTDAKDIRSFLQLVQDKLSEHSTLLPQIHRRGASVGCACYPGDAKDLDGLMKCADIAMYHAKKSGRSTYEIYSKEIGTMTPAELASAVEDAISNDELLLEYQPKVSVRSGKVESVEALVRWDHPTLGRLRPDLWIPAISNTPVIRQLGEWVVNKAITDQAAWANWGLDMRVAVNIGAEHFCSPDFTSWIIDCVAERNFDPRLMELEVTESTLFVSDARAVRIMTRLHRAGFKLSIDDFGTGYSNIARLGQLPVDCLKIDRSIISGADKDERMGVMLECIVDMATRLGCETVAEGVETASELAFVGRSGIDIVQGYYYSPSLPLSDLVDWARAHNALSEDELSPQARIVAA